METKNKILIAIVILVIVLACVAAFVFTNNDNPIALNATNLTSDANNTTDIIEVNNTVDLDNVTDTDDGNASDVNNNTTDYKVYNPQSDSYVSVIGEGYDDEVDRWYTYDTDGVRYYNTRIN